MSAARDLETLVEEQVAAIMKAVRAAYADPARGPVINDIRYTIDRDWTGDDAVHATVVLRDPVGREFFEHDELNPINELFYDLVRKHHVHRIPYMTFQLESEQAWLKEQEREDDEADDDKDDE